MVTGYESVASSVMHRKAWKPLHSAGKTCKLCYARENQAVSRSMGKGVVFISTAVSFFIILTRKIKLKNVNRRFDVVKRVQV